MNLRAFFSEERRNLVGFVRRLLRDAGEAEAEDVVQDVLLRLLERPGSAADVENLPAYVYRSLRNRVIDSQRARRPRIFLDEDWERGDALIDLLEDQSPALLDQLASRQGRQVLFEALSKLSDSERQVIIGREFDGRTYKELAALYDMPVNTLLSHRSRAMDKLRQYFSHRQESRHDSE